MARFLPFLAWFVLSLYATIDCVRTPRDRTPGGMARPLWIVVIWVIPILGALAWLLVKAAQRAEDGQALARGRSREDAPSSTRSGAAGPRRRGPLAPDDDPDFLADLAQQRRARLREERRRAKEARDPRRAGPAADETRPAGQTPGQRDDGVIDEGPEVPGDEHQGENGSARDERQDEPGA